MRAEDSAEREERQGEGEGEMLVTPDDAADVLDEGEAKLVIPPGWQVQQTAPTLQQLDPRNEASDELLDATIVMRFEDFGWCKGSIVEKNTDGRREVGGKMINFICKFDIDDDTSDLVLEAIDYDTSADTADYSAWLLLVPVTEAPAEV